MAKNERLCYYIRSYYTRMGRIAVVFHVTPECMTVHITDDPLPLIEGLLRHNNYTMNYNSRVFGHLYEHKRDGQQAWIAIRNADCWNIDAYWFDTYVGVWGTELTQFAKRAMLHGRQVDIDDALMVIYSLDA